MGAGQKAVTGSVVKKVAADGGRVRQSARGTTADAKKAVEKDTSPKQATGTTTGKKATGKKATAKTATKKSTAKKTATKKSAAKKTSGAKKTVAKKATGVRKAVAKKSGGKSGTATAKRTPAPSTVRALKQV